MEGSNGQAVAEAPAAPVGKGAWRKRKRSPRCECGQYSKKRYHQKVKHDKILGLYVPEPVSPAWEVVQDMADRLKPLIEGNEAVHRAFNHLLSAVSILKGE